MLYEDGLETLVVRKSILTPKGDYGDNWLRINFHTTFTIVDKAYKVTLTVKVVRTLSDETNQKL